MVATSIPIALTWVVILGAIVVVNFVNCFLLDPSGHFICSGHGPFRLPLVPSVSSITHRLLPTDTRVHKRTGIRGGMARIFLKDRTGHSCNHGFGVNQLLGITRSFLLPLEVLSSVELLPHLVIFLVLDRERTLFLLDMSFCVCVGFESVDIAPRHQMVLH